MKYKTIDELAKEKSFHLYMDVDDTRYILHSYVKTKDAIDNEFPVIMTTQVCLCKTSLFEKGYRIFVYPKVGERFEITLGKCECTDKEIRMAHSLDKMLLNGAFNKEGMVLL